MAAEVQEGVEVVKWYTRARKFPQLIGKTPDGANIWGGPYTYTQVFVGAAMLIAGGQTIQWWGRFGLVVNVVILLGVTYGVVVMIGRLPLGARNPFSVLVGVLQALTAPTHGKLGGTPFRLRRPHIARSTVIAVTGVEPISRSSTTRTPAAPPAAEVTIARRRAPRPIRRRPTPATIPDRRQPALTGVQRLLATAGVPSDPKD